AALLEEEAWLAVAGLGLLLLSRRRIAPGIGLTALGTTMLALAAFVVMPGFHEPHTLRGAAPTRSVGHFSTLRQDLGVLGARLVGSRGRDALASIILPTGGMLVLAPGTALAGLPTFAA